MSEEIHETRSPETMHVAYCIDVQGGGANQFNDQLFVSVKSLRDCRHPGDTVVCHILYAHVSVELMERLHAFDCDGFKVATQHIEDADMAYWQRFTRYDPRANVRSWGGIVYARIWMPLFLKGCDRCIYLDADTVVRSSLRDLWNTDLGGCLLGMNMGSVPEYGYNSGVMLMDLKAMRSDSTLYPRLGKFMEEHAREYKCPDQTVINRFFVGKIKDIGREWNFPPSQGVADPALKTARIWHFYNGTQKPYRLACDDFGRALVDWNNLLTGG